ncbi:MAG: hypothetical protein WC365_08225 [Candidatus Babeliales bacterium]|jgi:hypothetical protein
MTEKSMMANVIWLTNSERDKQKLKRKTRTTKTAAANQDTSAKNNEATIK